MYKKQQFGTNYWLNVVREKREQAKEEAFKEERAVMDW